MKSSKQLTVIGLHKILTKLIKDGDGKKHICVSKTTFTDNCEADGCTVLPVYYCRVERMLLHDGDGGIATTKDGRERSVSTAILFGNHSLSY